MQDITRIKRLWDELDSLNSHINCLCACTCKGKKKIAKSLEDQRLIQFLMGLNDVYSQARGNILMLNPLPRINHAYSLLLQDENQMEVYVNPQIPTNSSSFMAGNHHIVRQRPAKQRSKPVNQVHGQRSRSGTNQPQRGGFKPRKTKYNPNVSCTHCLNTGHVEDDCYRLIGYPEDFEFTNTKWYAVKGNAAYVTKE